MAAFAGKPDMPEIPELSDEDIEDARRRALALNSGGGFRSTIMSGGGVAAPILGSAAAMTGGLV